jgi:hypothetical protein
VQHQLAHPPHAGGVAVAPDEHVKLVAADANHLVIGAETFPQAQAHAAQQSVRGQRTESRLDAREAVESEREEGVSGAVRGSGLVQRVLERSYEVILLQARARGPLARLTGLGSME